MGIRQFRPGDTVIYRKSKHTKRPGRRAQEIRATTKGDQYSYFVDKFWIVRQVLEGGRLMLETRRGKTHVVSERDPNLRHPTLLQRVRYRDRFARLKHFQSDDAKGLR